MVLRIGLAGVRHPHIDLLLTTTAANPELGTIVALAEDDPQIRTDYAARLGATVHVYADYQTMLATEHLDLVATAAINSARAAIICDALAMGCHVLADKPLCTTLSDLAAIEAAWRASESHLAIMFEKRGWAPTLALQTVMEAGELGEVVLAWASAPHRLRRETRPAWMFEQAHYGGILNDLPIHDIDLLLWLTGAQTGRVQGFAGNRANRDRPEFEDYGQVYLQLTDGPLATLEAHWYSPEAAPYHGDYRLILTGTRGTAELQWAHNQLLVATHDTPPRMVPLPPMRPVVEEFLADLTAAKPPQLDTAAMLTATRIALLAQATANSGIWQAWAAIPPR